MDGLDFSDWIEEKDREEYFVGLVKTIIAQQLSSKAAATITKRFLDCMPNHTITPEHILSIPDQKLRDVGMSWSKVGYAKDLAHKVKNQTINLHHLHQLDNETVIKELTKVKGIGQWTAEMFLMFTLKREDVFSHGDLGLKRGIEKLYKISDPPKEQIETIIAPWSPYKTYGSVTLWHIQE